MVVLEHRAVVVAHREFALAVDFEHVVVAGVVDIVAEGGQQQAEPLQGAEAGLGALRLLHHVDAVHHVEPVVQVVEGVLPLVVFPFQVVEEIYELFLCQAELQPLFDQQRPG